MKTTIQAVIFESMPVKTVASRYGVARSTLQYCLKLVKRTEILDVGGDLMQCALNAVEVDGLKISKASDVFSVNEATLRKRFRRARPISEGRSPKKFTEAEEQVIKSILLNLAKVRVFFL